jgi:hypothetical protein
MMEGFRHGYREPGHLNGELTVPGPGSRCTWWSWFVATRIGSIAGTPRSRPGLRSGLVRGDVRLEPEG